MSVVRDHDAEWNVELGSFVLCNVWQGSLLASQAILGVVLQITVVGLESRDWQINLDSTITKSLTEATSDEHKASTMEFLETLVFVVLHLVLAWLQKHASGHLRFEGIKWVLTSH